MLVVLLELSNRASFREILSFMASEPRIVALNIIIAVSLTGFIYILVRKVWLSSFLALLLSTLMGFVNMSKFKYQGVPFLPWDIFLIQDAARVMPAMKNEFLDSKSIAFLGLAAILLLIVIAFYFFWDKKVNLKYNSNKLLGVVSSIVVITMFSSVLIGFSSENKYRADFFRTNAIITSIREMSMEKYRNLIS